LSRAQLAINKRLSIASKRGKDKCLLPETCKCFALLMNDSCGQVTNYYIHTAILSGSAFIFTMQPFQNFIVVVL